jgi:3-oxoacyl-[acyl-carrier-protein] synthase-3
MGTTIDHVHVTSGRVRHRHSALSLADTALQRCLAEADVAHGDVDLLLNAGLYHDRNMGEPAIAALIQDDVGLNAEDPHTDAHGTFSFDVANGACGPLTSLQIIDRFLQSGTVDRAAVVASDAHPGHRHAPGFPFAAAGAAAVCSWHPGPLGLGHFRWMSTPDDSYRAVIRHDGHANRLHIDVEDPFDHAAAAAAAKVVDEVLAEAGLRAADIDVTVAAPGSPVFVEALGAAAGLSPDRVVASAPGMHTAGLLAAFGGARADGRLSPGSTALLVSAGAGIVAGACLYRSRAVG